jgi:hypothetical protein
LEEVANVNGTLVSNNVELLIGLESGTSRYFYEKIDALFIFNRSLSEEEIRKLYQENR